MTTAPEHQAILDLLTAFGIDPKGVRAVTIRAEHLRPVRVQVERWVHDADPRLIAESYDVEARLSGRSAGGEQ